ncbi:MAG: hypothetical protein LBC82_02785 [Oscillospiraceae bacterium]|nr:hypothetical protein [Oscillospiraceae bacterium]
MNLNNARSNVSTNIGFRAALSHSQILQTYGVCFQHREEKGVCFRAGVVYLAAAAAGENTAKNKTAAMPKVNAPR